MEGKILLDIKTYIEKNLLKIEKKENTSVRFIVGVNENWITYTEEDVKKVIEHIKSIKLDKRFNELLFQYIDEKGLTDVETYKKADIDRRHFSKIKSEKAYKPNLSTIIKFGFALKLSIEEFERLLESVGKKLTNNTEYDLIVRYFFENRIYDLEYFNEVCSNFNFIKIDSSWKFL